MVDEFNFHIVLNRVNGLGFVSCDKSDNSPSASPHTIVFIVLIKNFLLPINKYDLSF